jgi:hypothetical protein
MELSILPGGGQLLQNLKLSLSANRTRRPQRTLLQRQLDGFKRKMEKTGELEGASVSEQRAFDVLAKGIADAFRSK